jgi:hypothetical protein
MKSKQSGFQTQQAMRVPEAGAIPTTTTYSDYGDVGGMRVPHRYIESTEMGGCTIHQVAFTLQPSTELGREK